MEKIVNNIRKRCKNWNKIIIRMETTKMHLGIMKDY